jgi:hypothetical protein
MATNLSYREKSLYASLAAELVVYGPYFFLHQQNSVNCHRSSENVIS